MIDLESDSLICSGSRWRSQELGVRLLVMV